MVISTCIVHLFKHTETKVQHYVTKIQITKPLLGRNKENTLLYKYATT